MLIARCRPRTRSAISVSSRCAISRAAAELDGSAALP